MEGKGVSKQVERMRYEWVDFLRGFSIIAIVFCHTVKSSFQFVPGLQEWLTMFMINIFFFLSGMLSDGKEYTPYQIIKKRMHSLIIPYILYSIVIISFQVIQYMIKELELTTLISGVYKTVVLSGIGTLWFIPVLLGVNILFHCLIVSPARKKRLLYFAGLFVSLLYTIMYQKIRSEHMLFQALNAPLITCSKIFLSSVFFVMGHSLKKMISIKKVDWKIITAVILLFIVSILLGSQIKGYDLNRLILPNVFVYMVVSSICVIGFVFFGRIMYLLGLRVKAVEWYGRNSLPIMCTHYSIGIPIANHLAGGGINLSPIDVICAVGILVAEIPVCLLLEKISPAFLGKKI